VALRSSRALLGRDLHRHRHRHRLLFRRPQRQPPRRLSRVPRTTLGERLARGDTPSFVADSPLKTSGAWMPLSGVRANVACAQASATLPPRAHGGVQSNSRGAQSFLLGTQSFLLGLPSSGTSRAKPFGLRAAF